MTLRNLLIVDAWIACVFGLGLVLIPQQLTAFYHITLNPGGVVVGQLLGVTLFGFGMLNWRARNVQDVHALRAIVLGNLVTDVLGFVIALLNQLAGTGEVNQFGWVNVVLFLVLTCGFAYFQFVKPGAL